MEVVDLRSVAVAALLRRLQQGAVLVLPTETAYGLVADSTNIRAVKRIYRIKGRAAGKPLPLICSSLSQVEKFFCVPHPLRQLAKKYWPGALSVQLKVKRVKSQVAMQVPTLDGTLVVRVSSDKLLRSLARRLGRPVTATSANLSGRGELYAGQDVVEQFQTRSIRPDIIINANKLARRRPSTIIGLEQNEVVVLRQGEISL